MKKTVGFDKGKALQAGIDAVEAKIKTSKEKRFEFENMVERDLMKLNTPALSYLRSKGISAIYDDKDQLIGYEKVK